MVARPRRVHQHGGSAGPGPTEAAGWSTALPETAIQTAIAPTPRGEGEIATLARHSAIYGLGFALQRVVGFLMVPIYTHFLVPADYGVVELLDLTVWLVGAIAGAGITTALVRFHEKAEGEAARREVVTAALAAALALNTAAAAVMLLASRPLAALLLGDPSRALLIRIAFVTYALQATIDVPLTYLRAREKPGAYTAASLIRLALALSLNVLFVVVFRMGVLGVFLSGLVTTGVMGLGLAALTLRETGLRVSRRRLAEIVRFGAPLVGLSLGMFAIHFGDRFFLRWYAGLDHVGVYALGYKFGFALSLLVQPVSLAWSVRVFKTMATPDGARTAARLFTLHVGLLAWIVLGLGGLASEIVWFVADPAYAAAAALIPVIALAYLFREAADFLKAVYLVEGKSTRIGAIVAGAAALCIALYWVLIPRMGGKGAALATLVTFGANLAAVAALVARARPLPVDPAALAKVALAGIGIFALLRGVAPAEDLARDSGRLALRLGLVAAYPLVLLALGFFRREEIAAARRAVGRLGRPR